VSSNGCTITVARPARTLIQILSASIDHKGDTDSTAKPVPRLHLDG
jgi:hypothetical protein